MKIQQLNNKKIALLGLGVENLALLKYLLKHKVSCQVTICDQRSENELKNKLGNRGGSKKITYRAEANFNRNLEDFDVVFRSPGWPIACPGIQSAIQKKKIESHRFKIDAWLYSPMKLFFDLCPAKNLIGITGTKGKGTTASLICAILKNNKRKVWLAGNIGIAPFEFIDQIKKTDYVVLELSSFQLEDLHKSPRLAVITNFSKEHLVPADPNNPNYHQTMKVYWESKANIFKHQSAKDVLIVNQNFKTSFKNIFSTVKSQVVYFGKSELKSNLIGEHNKENIAAALEVAKRLRVKDLVIRNTLAKFQGLEHRIEFVSEKDGIKYYNDSFATIPDSAITAIRSFDAPIVLLAGGADKGSDFSRLGKLIKQKIKFLILFKGVGSDKLKKEVLRFGYSEKNIALVDKMDDAFDWVKKNAVAGDVVLLSPGCASFGIFKNYKERGKLFKECCR